jgi:hypothetical protein
MESFGVPINTTKSVVATVPATEYLKVTSLNGHNVGAISWKMLMSGNSLMGRANIIFQFLSKGIITKNINPWIERSARPALHKPGLLSPTLIAIWTMLSNRGLITVDEALKALINGKVPTFRLAKAILLNADVNMIQGAIPKIFTEGVFKHIPNKSVEYIWSFEKPWFEHAMYSPLAVFLAKADLGAESSVLTKAMFDILMSRFHNTTDSMTDNIFKIVNRESAADNVLEFADSQTEFFGGNSSESSQEFNDLVVLFGTLQTYMVEKLRSISDRIINSKPNWGTSSLGELASANEDLARYNELKELPSRAELKMSNPDVAPPRIIKPTELRLIQLLRRMGNRPAFTTPMNRYEKGHQLLQQLKSSAKMARNHNFSDRGG